MICNVNVGKRRVVDSWQLRAFLSYVYEFNPVNSFRPLSRLFGTSDTNVCKIPPPLQEIWEIFSVVYKNLFHFPSVFRSVLQIRPTLFDRRRAVVYYYIYFPSRCVLALRPQEISASSLGFVTSALRTPRGTGFSPRRRAMRFPETSFSSIRLYERDVFVAKSLNCSAIFFASGNFVCRCASVGSVVDQKYPHTHGRQRFPCHFSVQLIECIIC